MKTLFPIVWRMGVLCAALIAIPSGRADTLYWDTSATDGGTITVGSGTWNLGTTASWNSSAVGSNPLQPWTDNSDSAAFVAGSSSATVTIDNSHGQVGAYGLLFSGAGGPTMQLGVTGGTNAFYLGAGGISDTLTNASSYLFISAPLVLTASQTWSGQTLSTTVPQRFYVNNSISSAAGTTTNLVFDGRGQLVGGQLIGGQLVLQGNNSYDGTTTVTGGGTLNLDYNAVANGKTGSPNTNRIDSAKALILAGGTLLMTPGTSSYTQAVGSTLITSGANKIQRSSTTTNTTLQLNVISQNVGATLTIASNSNSTNLNTIEANGTDVNGILGGWATFYTNVTTPTWQWATTGSSGVNNVIAGTSGTDATSSSSWQTTSNVNVTATSTETGIVSHTINALRLQTANVGLGLGSGSVLTITSGGIIAASTGQSINGGSLTTGMSTGELFVHTPNAFGIGSDIVDNGSTATALVKDGTGTLTVSGKTKYTGTTYVDAGTLQITTGNGTNNALNGSAVVQAGATLDVSSVTSGYHVTSGNSLTGAGTMVGNIIVESGGSLGPAVRYLDDQGSAHVTTGTMTIGSGALTLNSGSALNFELGTNADLLSLASGVTFTENGGITLNIFDGGGTTTQSYSLIQWLSGTPSISAGNLSDFNVVTNDGISGTLSIVGNSLVFTVSAVPEPSTVGFALFGLFSLVFLVRRRLPGKAAA